MIAARMTTGLRIAASVIALAFVIRYMTSQRRIEQERQATLAAQTRERLAPWKRWNIWRQNIIESEWNDGANR